MGRRDAKPQSTGHRSPGLRLVDAQTARNNQLAMERRAKRWAELGIAAPGQEQPA
jgi:hypothetical protein